MSTNTKGADCRPVKPELRPVVPAELLNVKDVAALLGGCSPRHIYRLADAGRMPPAIKLGFLVRWRRAELQAWIDMGCPNQHAGARRQ